MRLPIAAVFLASIACESYPWEGMVYPKTGQPPYDLAIGHFASLEKCRAAALAILAKTRAEPGATPDYECGRDCRVQKEPPPPPGMAPMRICKETQPDAKALTELQTRYSPVRFRPAPLCRTTT